MIAALVWNSASRSEKVLFRREKNFSCAARNLAQPAAAYLSEAQLHAVIGGRYRGDGRKVDAYVLWDTLDLDLE